MRRCLGLSIIPTDQVVIISIGEQALYLVADGYDTFRYSISTSKNTPSNVADSYGTPTGLHKIADCIGADAPAGMVFKGRQPQDLYHKLSKASQKENLITSRIMRLRGLENGFNAGQGVDSYERFIYIHGTNHENRIGEPFSGGCIEMKNNDIIELFQKLERNDLVWITRN